MAEGTLSPGLRESQLRDKAQWALSYPTAVPHGHGAQSTRSGALWLHRGVHMGTSEANFPLVHKTKAPTESRTCPGQLPAPRFPSKTPM